MRSNGSSLQNVDRRRDMRMGTEGRGKRQGSPTTAARRWNNRSAFAHQQLSPTNATIIFPFRSRAMSLVFFQFTPFSFSSQALIFRVKCTVTILNRNMSRLLDYLSDNLQYFGHNFGFSAANFGRSLY